MKKTGISVLVVVILLVTAIVIITSNTYSTLENGDAAFAVADTSTVTKVYIANKNENEVLLSRSTKGWTLDGNYNANQMMIDQMLGTLKRLKVKAPVSLAKHDNVVRRMAAVSTKVEIYQMVFRINLFNKIKFFEHEKLTKVFYVGGSTQDNLGTYMLMEGGERPYIVFLPSHRGYISTRFSPIQDDWKSHVVFNNNLSEIQSVRLTFGREPENSFRIDVVDGRGNYQLTELLTGNQMDSYDTLKLLNFLTSFRDLRYETRLNNIKSVVAIDSIVNSPSLYELTLVDQKQDTTYVKMFEKRETSMEDSGMELIFIPVDHDRFYGLINDGEDFVLMQYYSYDKVLKPLSYYIN